MLLARLLGRVSMIMGTCMCIWVGIDDKLAEFCITHTDRAQSLRCVCVIRNVIKPQAALYGR